jgi:hypothetical protein
MNRTAVFAPTILLDCRKLRPDEAFQSGVCNCCYSIYECLSTRDLLSFSLLVEAFASEDSKVTTLTGYFSLNNAWIVGKTKDNVCTLEKKLISAMILALIACIQPIHPECAVQGLNIINISFHNLNTFLLKSLCRISCRIAGDSTNFPVYFLVIQKLFYHRTTL